jgi:hypothetical protein
LPKQNWSHLPKNPVILTLLHDFYRGSDSAFHPETPKMMAPDAIMAFILSNKQW